MNDRGEIMTNTNEIGRIIRNYHQKLYANKSSNLEEMDAFLETYELPRLKQEETDNLNRPITSNKIEAVIKNVPKNKSPEPDGFPGEFYQTLKKEIIPIVLKLFQKIEMEGKLPNSFYEASITLIPIPDKDPTKKEINIPDEHGCQNSQQVLANRIQQYIKRIIHHDQVGFIPWMQGWFNIRKSISVIDYINKKKAKNHMMLSIDPEKAFNKIQHPFLIRTLQSVGIEGTFLNLIKTIYESLQ